MLTDAERRADAAKRDFEDVSTLLRAESARFESEKVEDFKDAICAFVDRMSLNQAEVVRAWEGYQAIVERISKAIAPPTPAATAEPTDPLSS